MKRCRVQCEASYPIPEYVDCYPIGWQIDGDQVRCDATKHGLSPGAQLALIGAILLAVCVLTAFYQKR